MIDTHCHINLPEYFPDPVAAIDDALARGLEALIAVGIDMESSRRAVELADAHPAVYAIVGWHPNSTATYTPSTLPEIEALWRHPKTVAIGEIGLDYHWDYATKDQQFRALRDQLDLAASLDAPVVFHCREAYGDVLTELEARPPRPYLLHCFAGNHDDARRAVALDCTFGVDGPISYKKADDLRAIVRGLPRDRIVVETDSPFLTPEPFRGRPNRPGHVEHVVAALARTLDLAAESCAELTTDNARRFFPKLLPGPRATAGERNR